jgi:hypothetical protein
MILHWHSLCQKLCWYSQPGLSSLSWTLQSGHSQPGLDLAVRTFPAWPLVFILAWTLQLGHSQPGLDLACWPWQVIESNGWLCLGDRPTYYFLAIWPTVSYFLWLVVSTAWLAQYRPFTVV